MDQKNHMVVVVVVARVTHRATPMGSVQTAPNSRFVGLLAHANMCCVSCGVTPAVWALVVDVWVDTVHVVI